MCKKVLKITAIVLLLSGGLYSCGKKAESDGEVPYKPCPCEDFNYEYLMTIKGEARLFFDEGFGPPPFDDCERIAVFSGNDENTLDKHPEYVSMYLDDRRYRMSPRIDFCNFPDFAQEWKTPGGIIVYYEAEVYQDWCGLTGGVCRYICYSAMFTKLTKK